MGDYEPVRSLFSKPRRPLPPRIAHYGGANLLGLPQDARMLSFAPADGGVVTAALEPALLERHPIRMASRYPGTDRTALLRGGPGIDPAPPDPAREREMKKLRSLGYIH